MSHYAPMSYAAHCETQTFNDLLVEQLKSTPWVVASLAFHVAIAIILSFMGTIGRQIEEIPVIHAQAAVRGSSTQNISAGYAHTDSRSLRT